MKETRSREQDDKYYECGRACTRIKRLVSLSVADGVKNTLLHWTLTQQSFRLFESEKPKEIE